MTEVFALLVGLLLEGVIRITAHHSTQNTSNIDHSSHYFTIHTSSRGASVITWTQHAMFNSHVQHTVSAPCTHFIQYTCQTVGFVYFTHYNAVGRVATDYTQSQQTLKSDAVENFKDMYMEDYKSSVEERVHIKHQHCKVLN